MKTARRVGLILALACTCVGLYAGGATAAGKDTHCGSSVGGMYACVVTDFYTSACGATHYAFVDVYAMGERANSGWWSSGASVSAHANGFGCSSTVNPLAASKSVTIGWYNCCEGTSGALTLNWPPIYAGQGGYLSDFAGFTVHYGTTTYGSVSARWCPWAC